MEPVKAAWLTYGTGRLGPRGLTVVPTDTTKNVPDLMSQTQHQVCAIRTKFMFLHNFEISMKVSFNQSDQTTVIDVFQPSTVAIEAFQDLGGRNDKQTVFIDPDRNEDQLDYCPA